MANAIPTIFPNGKSVNELYYVAPAKHLPSILTRGILSRLRAEHLHIIQEDYSKREVQEYRAKTIVSNPKRDELGKAALTLHGYVPLYPRAHNAKVHNNKDSANELCICRVDPSILKHPEAVICEVNGAKKESQFFPVSTFQFSQESAAILENPLSLVNHDDQSTKKKRKAVQQAEVDIPHGIHQSYIRGVYVANEVAKANLIQQFNGQSPLPVDIHPSLFFQSKVILEDGLNPLLPIAAKPFANQLFPSPTLDYLDSDDEDDTFANKAQNLQVADDDSAYDSPISDEELLAIDLSAFSNPEELEILESKEYQDILSSIKQLKEKRGLKRFNQRFHPFQRRVQSHPMALGQKAHSPHQLPLKADSPKDSTTDSISNGSNSPRSDEEPVLAPDRLSIEKPFS